MKEYHRLSIVGCRNWCFDNLSFSMLYFFVSLISSWNYVIDFWMIIHFAVGCGRGFYLFSFTCLLVLLLQCHVCKFFLLFYLDSWFARLICFFAENWNNGPYFWWSGDGLFLITLVCHKTCMFTETAQQDFHDSKRKNKKNELMGF